MIAALLIGRKGSVGFPGKNTMTVLGRPPHVRLLDAGDENSRYVDSHAPC